MRAFILTLRPRLQLVFVLILTIALAFAIAFIFNKFFDTHQLEANTDLSASVYQVLGTVYAILLTFTLWGVWQKFNDANKSVQQEAYALMDLVHNVEASSEWKNINVRAAALAYAQNVVAKEWKMFGKMSAKSINLNEKKHPITSELVKEVQSISPKDDREIAIFSLTLSLLMAWLDARRTRILIARGNSAKALWPLLISGALVLFAFHGLFVAKTLGIWISLLFGFSLVIGLTFYLIFALDSPFEGSLSIDSEPFELVINILEDQK
jgi:hypothetical protein